ncbi:MAG TPA: hypothetical protein VFI06_16420 [Chitinophagaceae bacterium]|nr:hypothetical protein [Chitinophagaceae bacterium]
MTFLDALYGSQYYEIQQKGRDGNKGRLNGNMFLSAMIILLLVAVLLLAISTMPWFAREATQLNSSTFGNSGKYAGRLLAIPLFAAIYILVAVTVGSEANFKKHVDVFLQYPEEEKKKANARLLVPFFSLLILVFVLVVVG